MYTTCTFRLAQVLDAPFLEVIPRWFVWISLAALLAASIGLIRHLVRLRT